MFPRLALIVLLLAPAACSFDGGGVGGGGDDDGDAGVVPIDGGGDGDAPDAAPGIDATPDALIDDPDDDDDTILDVDDNCVALPNTDQHDEDGDGVGDVCDNCPHVGNTNQANTSEEDAGLEADGVGDACDPDGDARNEIVLFEPFKGNALPPGWTAVGGTWTVSGDELHQTALSQTPSILYYSGGTWTSMVVDAMIDLDTVPPAGNDSPSRSIGVLTFYAPGATFGTGYLCSLYDEMDTLTVAAMYLSRLADTGTTTLLTTGVALDTALAAAQTYFTRSTALPGNKRCDAVARSMSWTRSSTDATHASGTLALRATMISASFRHVVVIAEVTP